MHFNITQGRRRGYRAVLVNSKRRVHNIIMLVRGAVLKNYWGGERWKTGGTEEYGRGGDEPVPICFWDGEKSK